MALFITGFFIALIGICIYAINFGKWWSFGSQEQFGQFGDYIGGLINPILSFLTVTLLIWSVQIQIKELEETREEMKRSADAAEMQIDILRKNQHLNKTEDGYQHNYKLCESMLHEKNFTHILDLAADTYSAYEIYQKRERSETSADRILQAISRQEIGNYRVKKFTVSKLQQKLEILSIFSSKLMKALNDKDYVSVIYYESIEIFDIANKSGIITDFSYTNFENTLMTARNNANERILSSTI